MRNDRTKIVCPNIDCPPNCRFVDDPGVVCRKTLQKPIIQEP